MASASNWEELKKLAPAVSMRLSDYVNFRDLTDVIAPGQSVELKDETRTMTGANLQPAGGGAAATPDQTVPEVEEPQGEVDGVMPEVMPEPETVTPEVTPEPETVTPEVTPEPETVTPEVTPEPETVTPEVPLAPDQSVPTIDGGTDQGLVDVNPVDPKIADSTTSTDSSGSGFGLSKKRKRARDADGKFLGDDPTTTVNEAWVDQ